LGVSKIVAKSRGPENSDEQKSGLSLGKRGKEKVQRKQKGSKKENGSRIYGKKCDRETVSPYLTT